MEYYTDYDKTTESWCVFDTETGKAHSSWPDEHAAREEAARRNREQPSTADQE